MSTLTEILRHKQGRPVQRVDQSLTVLQAVHLMNDFGIGAVIVEQNGRMTGMFTERDVLRRIVAAELNPAATRVLDVMTTDVICGSPETSIDEARGLMRDHRIRHLPILDDSGDIVGLISIGDLNAHLSDAQESQIHSLHEYLHGRV